MEITALDHLVLTVKSIEATVSFYEQVLGMSAMTFGAGRVALRFGDQKINLHQKGSEFDPKADHPTPGSADLCFVASGTVEGIVEHLRLVRIDILEGPVDRTGAKGPIRSVYIRDPDQNLIEISVYGNDA
jgi:catechol 2,3-dioxygenase-like lactoylglutathione lyase family enzyme